MATVHCYYMILDVVVHCCVLEYMACMGYMAITLSLPTHQGTSHSYDETSSLGTWDMNAYRRIDCEQ